MFCPPINFSNTQYILCKYICFSAISRFEVGNFLRKHVNCVVIFLSKQKLYRKFATETDHENFVRKTDHINPAGNLQNFSRRRLIL